MKRTYLVEIELEEELYENLGINPIDMLNTNIPLYIYGSSVVSVGMPNGDASRYVD